METWAKESDLQFLVSGMPDIPALTEKFVLNDVRILPDDTDGLLEKVSFFKFAQNTCMVFRYICFQ